MIHGAHAKYIHDNNWCTLATDQPFKQ